MAIVITLPDTFEIENYTGLQAFLTSHLQLDADTVAQLPNLIRLAELRLNRQIVAPDRETVGALTTAPGVQFVNLPVGCKQVRQLKILGDETTGYPLAQVTPNTLETYDYPGRPVVYSIMAGGLYLGPVPDDAFTLSLVYMAKLPPLTADRQTNWLLVDNADAYVYMAAAVISKHLGDESEASQYLALADAVIDEINTQGVRYRNSGPIALRSPVSV